MAENYALKHQEMVREQLIRRGIDNQRVLDAFTRVKRHHYVPEDKRPNAYEDSPLAIGANQTISQPYVVAYILAELNLNGAERVLEIGTGSGYQTALLAELSTQVYSIEFVPELAAQARQILTKTGYHNIAIRIGNGREGWPEAMPFDAVVASAAPAEIPPALIKQLAPRGRLILPLGVEEQHLVIVQHRETGFHQRQLLPVRFVPMH